MQKPKKENSENFKNYIFYLEIENISWLKQLIFNLNDKTHRF